MIILLSLFSLVAPSASAQTDGGGSEQLYRWDGGNRHDRLGTSVSGAGDINGDCFPDVIVGASAAGPRALDYNGSAYVYVIRPFLLASTSAISASTGGVLNLTLEFPDTAALQNYVTLMSVHGLGPRNYGVEMPLSLDHFPCWSLQLCD